MDDLFLKSGFPRLYEHVLRLPVIRSIRRQEQQTLRRTFAENLDGADQVLEVGAGTGFYTFDIASGVKSITALEQSPGMTRILRERILSAGTRNITVVESDFFSCAPDRRFDVVIAIGVLDCVNDAKTFLARCISLATKCVIVTIPRSSFWASIHSFFGGMMGVRVSVYTPEEIASYLRGYRYTLTETGLRTSWTHGLTLVAVIRTSQEQDSREGIL
ncbi:MAG: class I SAM-dependent methyltransferase [Candidatus Acidiferrales bacterium]